MDPPKSQAIMDMLAPKTEKQVWSFLGRINYIAHFIEKLIATCDPLFKLLKKDTMIEWIDECQVAFDRIKKYFLNPSILVPQTLGH